MNSITTRYKSFYRCAVALAALAAWAPAAHAITIDTMPVGNPGNANDPTTGNSFGRVTFSYNIGKYDVTVGQYTTFLNAVAATDTYGLYNTSLATNLNIAGIAQSGLSGSFSYSVIGSPDKPVTYVSWGDAARFANWMNNNQPTGPQGPATTENGAYALNGAVTAADLDAVTRSVGATWVIPNENEWYKAAYYNQTDSSYFSYPTSSNTNPTSALPGSLPNTANVRSGTGAFAATGSSTLDSNQNYLTNVGAYTATASPYGAFDMGGDVFQWNEALIGSARGLRGGSWGDNAFQLQSQNRAVIANPTFENAFMGFRLAEVPEPTAAALAVVACGLFLVLRNRFR